MLPKGMEVTPELIDSVVIQLDGAIAGFPGAPDYVKEDAKKFLKSLDKWSGEMKQSRASKPNV
jgi:hypothetical protein